MPEKYTQEAFDDAGKSVLLVTDMQSVKPASAWPMPRPIGFTCASKWSFQVLRANKRPDAPLSRKEIVLVNAVGSDASLLTKGVGCSAVTDRLAVPSEPSLDFRLVFALSAPRNSYCCR